MRASTHCGDSNSDEDFRSECYVCGEKDVYKREKAHVEVNGSSERHTIERGVQSDLLGDRKRTSIDA